MKKQTEPFDPSFDDKRLRVFDLMTPWFWIVCFYQPRIYGEAWFMIEIFEPLFEPTWRWYCWVWERKPTGAGMEMYEPMTTEDDASYHEPLVNEDRFPCELCGSDKHNALHCPNK